MKPLYLLSLSALVCAAFAAGCYGSEQVPVQTGVQGTGTPPPPPATPTGMVHAPAPSAPPAQPLVLTAEPQPPNGPAQNVAPPPLGATEMQPLPAQVGPDTGTRVRQITLLATQQIERLSLREKKAVGTVRDDIEAFLVDLKVRRDKVQQDYRELQTQQGAGAGTLTVELDHQIAGLRDAINDSYQLESPAGHALPPPAPIPPSELP